MTADTRRNIQENEKRGKYLDLTRGLKFYGNKSNGVANINWCTWNCAQVLGKKPGKNRNKKTSRNYQIFSIFKIGQNTENSPLDLKRLAVTRVSVKDPYLMLVLKTLGIK